MDTTANGNQRYRLLVLGSGHVGKTSLIRRYLHNTFSEKYKETLDDIYPRDFHISGYNLPLDIYDTNFYYPDMRRVSIGSADSFMLVFAIDDVNSFKNVTELFKEIMDRRPTDYEEVPIVLIGNKNDVSDKKIYRDTVQIWLNHLPSSKKSIPYFETSAKTGENIVDIFKSLLDQSRFPQNSHLCHPRTSSIVVNLPSSPNPNRDRPRPPPPRRQMSQQISIRCLSAGRYDHDKSDEDNEIDYDDHRSPVDHRSYAPHDQSNQRDKIGNHNDHGDEKSTRSINEKRISRFARQLSIKKEKLPPAVVGSYHPAVQSIANHEDESIKISDTKRGALTRHGSLMKKPTERQRLSLKMKKSTIDEPDESDCKIS